MHAKDFRFVNFRRVLDSWMKKTDWCSHQEEENLWQKYWFWNVTFRITTAYIFFVFSMHAHFWFALTRITSKSRRFLICNCYWRNLKIHALIGRNTFKRRTCIPFKSRKQEYQTFLRISYELPGLQAKIRHPETCVRWSLNKPVY